MINVGVGKTSDPKNLPQQIFDMNFIQQFQMVIKLAGVVHNHPSGDPTPSRADIEMTKTIMDVLAPLGITVHDHIIVGRDGHASLKGLQLI